MHGKRLQFIVRSAETVGEISAYHPTCAHGFLHRIVHVQELFALHPIKGDSGTVTGSVEAMPRYDLENPQVLMFFKEASVQKYNHHAEDLVSIDILLSLITESRRYISFLYISYHK